jgi:hypothetical protein
MHKFVKACKLSKIILYILSNTFITRHCKLIFVIHFFDSICFKIRASVTRLTLKTTVILYKHLCNYLLLLLCNRNYLLPCRVTITGVIHVQNSTSVYGFVLIVLVSFRLS